MADARRIAPGRRVIAVLVTVVVSMVLFGCIAGSQTRDLMTRTKSPDGRWIVRVYYVNPGASASAFVVVEATASAGGKTTEVANLGPDELAVAVWANDEELYLKWQSNSHLIVGGFPAEMPSP